MLSSPLKIGSSGPDVVYLQHLLATRGFKISIDGQFGPGTNAIVQKFQTANGIFADGLVTDQLEQLMISGVPTLPGIDVSYWDQGCDFTKVGSAAQFVYIKVSEGLTYQDPTAAAHANGAKAAGLKVGYYHFAHTESDAGAEAIFFNKCCSNLPAADLPYVLDIEVNKANLSPALFLTWIETFLGTIQQLGHKGMIYSYTPFLNQNLPSNHTLGSYPLWIAAYTNASYPTMPVGWPNYTVWQYSQAGNVPGIPVHCDMNKAVTSFLS
jgi:lysozyme